MRRGLIPALSVLFAAAAIPAAAAPSPAAFDGRNGRIAFVRIQDGTDREILSMKGDGSGTLQLTDNEDEDYSPAWSANGKRIAFISERTGNPDLFIMKADGTGVQQVTDTPDEEAAPAWSPFGTRIAYSLDPNFTDREIFTIGTDGTHRFKLTKNNFAEDTNPAWSPRGKRIVFQSDFNPLTIVGDLEISTIKPDGTGLKQVTDNAVPDFQPNWAPDNSRIVFVRQPPGVLDEIFTIRPDGTHPLRLTNDTIEDLSPCYSPNGGRIAFTSQGRDGFDRDVFAMSSGGSNIVNLTPNDLFDDRPDWQPVTRPL